MKWIKYIQYLFVAISVATLAYLVFSMTQGNEAAGVDIMLKWAYVSLAVAIIVSLVFPIANLFSNPKGAGKTLLYLLACVVIIGGCYMMSSTEPVVNSAGGFFEDPFTLKITDTGLYTAYITLVITAVAAIGSEIFAALK